MEVFPGNQNIIDLMVTTDQMNKTGVEAIMNSLITAFESSTKEVFEKFFRLFNKSGENLKEEESLKAPIDTVIITGRSSKFVLLQEAIEKHIEDIANDKKRFIYRQKFNQH